MEIKSFLKACYWEMRCFSFRALLLRLRLKRCGKKLRLKPHCSIVNPRYISIGNNVVIDHHAELFVYKEPGTREAPPQLIIGDSVHLGKYNCIGCNYKIIIEDHVLFAPYVHITDRNHSFEDVDTPIWLQPTQICGAVVIGRATWLGFGVQVMSGVTIGKHCVIAAGSVVTKDIPDFSVAAGVPARIIKHYNSQAKKWETVKK